MKTTTVVVLGNARSGTSATAGILKALGVKMDYIPGIVTKTKVEKAKGELYESIKASRINALIYLEALGIDVEKFVGEIHWNLPHPRPEEIERFLGDYDELIETFLGLNSGLWGFKNPKTSLALKHWQRKLINPKYVIVTRNPLNIAKSWEGLKVNVGMTKKEGKKPLWNVMYENHYLYNYIFECLQYEDPKNYMFISYEELLNNSMEVIADLSKFIGVRLTKDKGAKALDVLASNKKY